MIVFMANIISQNTFAGNRVIAIWRIWSDLGKRFGAIFVFVLIKCGMGFYDRLKDCFEGSFFWDLQNITGIEGGFFTGTCAWIYGVPIVIV